jgi:RNA polymerase sigma-70 factor (ECF subfamily)
MPGCGIWNWLDDFRPDLYRYCRRLTGNVWDAEDLVQDTLEQSFARLGLLSNPIDNPRGYLLKIASNRWISRKRHERVERAGLDAEQLAPQPAASPERDSTLRDAGAALLERLAPQERAAVLLKETFEFTLDEIAELLGTSVGAVKAALHRGRERLRDADDGATGRPRRS